MSIRTFITDLQNSDGSRKFRWLIGLTIVSVLLIGGIWFFVSPGGSSPSGDLVRKEDQPTIWSKLVLSTEHVIDVLRFKTANTINFFSHKFGITNTIEVQTSTSTESK